MLLFYQRATIVGTTQGRHGGRGGGERERGGEQEREKGVGLLNRNLQSKQTKPIRIAKLNKN